MYIDISLSTIVYLSSMMTPLMRLGYGVYMMKKCVRGTDRNHMCGLHGLERMYVGTYMRT